MEEEQSPGICGKERDWEVSRTGIGDSGPEQWGSGISEAWRTGALSRYTFRIFLITLNS